MKLLKKYRAYDYDDLDFMSPMAAAHNHRERKSASLLLYIIVAMLVSFLIWAKYALVDEITHAEGRVIPSSHIQTVSNLEGGIIESILIKEGQTVEKDQILIKINSTAAQARAQEGKDYYYRYLAAVERLKSQIENRNFVIPDVIQASAPEVGQQEMIRYQGRIQKLNNEIDIAKSDVEQKKQELLELQNHQQQLSNQLDLINQEIKINQPLVQQGLTAKVDFLRLQREAAELSGQLGSAIANVAKAQSALGQAQEKFQRVPIAYRAEDFTELREAENKLADSKGSFTTEGDRLNRTEIRSPVKGVIKQLLISTIGGVVKPGEDIVEIVPIEDSLLIEAQVLPADIAFLRPKLKAQVKLTAYDFSIYGGLDAELVEIGADTIEDKEKQNKRFFRIRLRTLGNKFSKSSKQLTIIPGMTATVDIVTGHKTILDYLLKPILKARQNALTER